MERLLIKYLEKYGVLIPAQGPNLDIKRMSNSSFLRCFFSLSSDSANLHRSTMACFNPCYTMPGAVGFGSCRTGPNISGWGGYGYSGFGGGIGGGPSGMLGLTSGDNISRSSQLPPSEIVIQPPTCVLRVPEPVISTIMPPMILSSSSPCSYGSQGYGYESGYGYGSGSVGGCLRGGIMGGFPSISPPRGRCNIYRYPC